MSPVSRVSPPQHRGVKAAIVVLIAIVVVLGGGVVASALYLQTKLDVGIQRFGDPFADLVVRPATHPVATSAAPVNFLVLGSDSLISAGEPTTWEEGAQRTDAVMIAQLSGDRRSASILSLPRDSWVEIPGHGEHKLNAAFALGGPALTVRTVEELTGITIDHVVVADFASFAAVTDIVGGVAVPVTEPLRVDDEELAPGEHLLDGDQALAYARQRHGLPEGDLSRIERQQVWLRAMVEAVHREGVLTDVGALVPFLESVGRTLAVDDGLTVQRMRNLVFSARELRAADTTFLTAPVLGLGRSPDGTQSIVRLDRETLADIGAAISAGTLNDYLAGGPDNVRTLDTAGE